MLIVYYDIYNIVINFIPENFYFSLFIKETKFSCKLNGCLLLLLYIIYLLLSFVRIIDVSNYVFSLLSWLMNKCLFLYWNRLFQSLSKKKQSAFVKLIQEEQIGCFYLNKILIPSSYMEWLICMDWLIGGCLKSSEYLCMIILKEGCTYLCPLLG